ncbi:MAG: heat-inducible transcriptional repressor HrcA [Clostridia bacterium]|jgi:heat-inducible transcriptional repressor|nr:heat-inducible transcriptional repressor HrcA [Clostridia bacterium]MDH7573632.1 heat-inducible transcriptional repressor HrcA [Clostridia bacterium]
MYLDTRKRRILEVVVQEYIATAEPVGSRTLARKYNLGVSPATIRNEMADLEEMGFLEQPHTSAGRIPSDLGYRYYVDYLMEKQPLTPEEQEFIAQSLITKLEAVEELIARTSEVLSAMTNLTGLALGPQWAKSVILHVELLSLAPRRALLLVVTNVGTIQHRFLDLPEEITPGDLTVISRVLTRHLRGSTLDILRRVALQEMQAELASYRRVVRTVLEAVEDAVSGSRAERIYLGGTLNILNQPEFRRDLEKVKGVLNLLETEPLLRQLLLQETEAELAVRIGGENKAFNMPYCSLVTATYRVGDEVVGAIGLLGPTRMEYARAVAMVEYISSLLSEIMARFYR